MPEVTIIIPNYNHAQFLKQRIESVLNQTYRDFELIILDDKSTDDSLAIIEQYSGNEKISHIVYNDVNSGSPFKQWQLGISLAKGKYIWIAESDDYADKHLLYHLVQPFKVYNDLVLSYCQSAVVDATGKYLGLSEWAQPLDINKWKADYVVSTESELKHYLKYRNTIPNASAVLFIKPNDITVLDESCNFKMAGDWIFWKKMLTIKGKISFNSKALNFFRLHEHTTRSTTTREKELIRLKEFKHLIGNNWTNPFFDYYDWMLLSWWSNRKLLKGTSYYYLPDFPKTVLLRLPWFLVKKFIERFISKSNKIDVKKNSNIK
jgi:glycosyltransferase involved in cell wall biosynthesis